MRQSLNSPPAVIFVGIVGKIVPVIIGRVFALICTYAVIGRIFVKIYAVGAGVVKHAVEYYAYAFFLSLLAQIFKNLLIAE